MRMNVMKLFFYIFPLNSVVNLYINRLFLLTYYDLLKCKYTSYATV